VGNVLVLRLLGRGVKDTLPAVDLHADIQLKVNVSLRRRAAETASGRRARPALAEQLTHGGKPGGLPVRRLAAGKRERKGIFGEWRNTATLYLYILCVCVCVWGGGG